MYPQTEFAGFWKRFLAFILDQLILGFARLLIFVPFWFFILAGYFYSDGFDRPGRRFIITSLNNSDTIPYALISLAVIVLLLFGLLNLIGEWLYYAFMESSAKQATYGKIIAGIKVTDAEGKRITFGRATARYFGKILSGMILMIGYIMAGFTEKKQALHDILSNCLVVNSISFYVNDKEIRI